MNDHTLADSLHRLVKQSIDSGVAASLAEAEAMFLGYKLAFAIDAAEAADPLHQAALLTGVVLAQRVFLGGVLVTGAVDGPLLVPLPLGGNLAEAVASLGGSTDRVPVNTPLVSVGGGVRPRRPGFHVRTVVAGWRGGIVPAHSELTPAAGPAMPLAGMLAAALAVNEAFLHVSQSGGAAGHRQIGLSLWEPSSIEWLSPRTEEPALRFLPSCLWLIGLGHLGQAYLWGLGLLPYPDSAGLSLVLQDVDQITPSSESTSLLTDQGSVGLLKTRVLALWAERRGFTTAIYERLFDDSFRRQDHEPAVALCGIDNALGRQALDQVGFDLVVEAGLGRGHQNFRTIRLHTLPGPRPAAELWQGGDDAEGVTSRAAYQKLLGDGELDRCGITLLAGKAIGAPFVGAVAACLVLSEVLRLLHGGTLHHVIEMDLEGIEHRSAIARGPEFGSFNPGFVRVVS